MSVLHWMNIYIQYPSLLLNFLVLLVSLKVPSSIPKTFCLNLVFPCLLCTIYILAEYHTQFIFKDSFSLPYIITFNTLETVLYQAALKSYETQATFSIFLAYMSLTQPFFYQKVVASRGVRVGFIFAHVLSWAIAFEMTFEVHWYYWRPYSEQILYVHTVARLVVEGLIYVAMVVLYFMTLFKVISFYRKSHSVPTNQSARWRILLSLLLYCTPPNLFLIAGIPGNYCGADVNVFNYTHTLNTSTCGIVYDFSKQMVTLRLFVTSLTALLAFKDYRRALSSSTMCVLRKVPMLRTNLVAVRSTASAVITSAAR